MTHVTHVTHVTHDNARYPAWHAAARPQRGGRGPTRAWHLCAWKPLPQDLAGSWGQNPVSLQDALCPPPGTLLGGHPGGATIQVRETAMTHLGWASAGPPRPTLSGSSPVAPACLKKPRLEAAWGRGWGPFLSDVFANQPWSKRPGGAALRPGGVGAGLRTQKVAGRPQEAFLGTREESLCLC